MDVETHSLAARTPRSPLRVVADGKFLTAAGEPFVVRGVTYGSFAERADGRRFPEHAQIVADADHIARLGLNSIRVYETPPPELLDESWGRGVRILTGLQYRDWRYEDIPGRAARRRVREEAMRALDAALEVCADHPGVLALSIGNEVPADIVRVHGIGAVTELLGEVVEAAHRADPGLLVTYASFPSTEYLEVEGIDLVCFNVFLEHPDQFHRYLKHLQIVSGDLPLIVAELGLAAEVHGELAQRDLLARQLRTIDEVGCAGAMVFSYTDDWSVGGAPVDGWGFGVTDIGRTDKPSAVAVSAWANSDLKDLRAEWPQVSVVVCAFNEANSIQACLESLERCDYPDLQVIVCDDGSTDSTREIARRFPFTLIELEHGGLSRARNAGVAAASGEIVAFLDADAACHVRWPWHLVLAFHDGVTAVGGPNLPVAGGGLVERAVACSPGAPQAVLLGDDRAEHVPGCNMAFRRTALIDVGGFDPAYTSAGDDVDVCWKVLDASGSIGYSPAAQVYHHRRASVRGYLRQQRGYGRAERMLLSAHPHRFNRLGQASWSGAIYGGTRLLPWVLRPVVYHGYHGQAPYQHVSQQPARAVTLWIGALLPLCAPLAAVGALLGLVSAWFLLVPAALAALVVAYGSTVAASVSVDRTESRPRALCLLVGWLHIAQPFVRVWGRITGPRGPRPAWQARPWWGDRATWLHDLDRLLRSSSCVVVAGGPHDSWDLSVTRRGLLSARIVTAVAWRWNQQWRVRWSVRWGHLVVVAALIAMCALVFQARVGAAATVVVAALAAADWLMLRSRIAGALARCRPPVASAGDQR